ncbi:MAG: urease subunit gamma [Moraxella sp.]|nr:urease subunit gamma [Moraxella sp.]
MNLTAHEKDKLMLYTVGMIAERRKAMGIKLNYPEAVAYISMRLLDGARMGKTVATLMSEGAAYLGADDVMAGVGEMIDEVQIEATFLDGSKLVTVHNPVV